MSRINDTFDLRYRDFVAVIGIAWPDDKVDIVRGLSDTDTRRDISVLILDTEVARLICPPVGLHLIGLVAHLEVPITECPIWARRRLTAYQLHCKLFVSLTQSQVGSEHPSKYTGEIFGKITHCRGILPGGKQLPWLKNIQSHKNVWEIIQIPVK